MRWIELRRAWMMLAWWYAIGLAAACGGGKDGGTLPDGGALPGTYRLAGINDDAAPALAQMENCTPSRFAAGSMGMDPDGTWQMAINWDDETGNHVLRDHGRYQRAQDDLSFDSAEYGDGFEGAVDGELVLLHYDFCSNSQADVDLAFAK
jgi:hypothetical protein